jgi:hypothetical protein
LKLESTIVTKRNWDTAHLRAKLSDEHSRAKEIIAVPTDKSFWKAWRDDPAGMRASGYHVRKDRDGRWRAWNRTISKRQRSAEHDGQS